MEPAAGPHRRVCVLKPCAWQLFRAAWAEYRADFGQFLGSVAARGSAATPPGEAEDRARAGTAGEASEMRREAGTGSRGPRCPDAASGPRLHPSPAAGVAAAGLESLRPYLGELYRSRAGAYRDGLREFVLSYREAYDAAAAAPPFSSAPGPDDSTDSGRPEEERKSRSSAAASTKRDGRTNSCAGGS